MKKFKFLTSERFWAVVLGAVILCLNKEGVINENITTMLETILFAFVGIRTVDRFGEKIGGVSKVLNEK